METYKPTTLKTQKKKKYNRVIYAIGENDGKGTFRMWSGPVTDEVTMLETVGRSNKSCIVRFNVDETAEVIWKWNNTDNVWGKHSDIIAAYYTIQYNGKEITHC